MLVGKQAPEPGKKEGAKPREGYYVMLASDQDDVSWVPAARLAGIPNTKTPGDEQFAAEAGWTWLSGVGLGAAEWQHKDVALALASMAEAIANGTPLVGAQP